MTDEDELGDFETETTTDEEIEDQEDAEDAGEELLDEMDDNDEMMMAQDDPAPEPVRDSDDYAEGRADAQSVGTEIRGKIKRGTETRDQDEIVIKGRGVNAQEAADDFEQALTRAEEGDWAGRLRKLRDTSEQPEE